MAVQSWVLTDVARGVYTPDFSLAADDLGAGAGPSGYSVVKQTLRGGLCDGVDQIRIENGDLAFVVLPTRGMGLWKARLGEWEIGWRSPVRGPVHPKFVPLGEPSGLGWLDGFDELLVRCGLESNGSPEFDDDGRLRYPLHGRIANRPAQRVELRFDADAREVSLVGEVEETRFLFTQLRLTTTISTRLGEPAIRIRDEVENLSAREGEMQLLYHINLGAPLLEAGAQAVVPAKTVAPRNARAAEGVDSWSVYGPPEPGFAEQVYFFELHADADGNTGALLKDAQGARGVSVHFNRRQLPHFILWKNTAAIEDGYVTGLEPAVNFPNPRTFEGKHGRVVKVAPGQKATFDLRLEFHGDRRAVEQAEAALRTIQGERTPTIHASPQPGWSPA